MRKIVWFVCLVWGAFSMIETVHAQSRHQKGFFERVESEKIAFITKDLQLTPKEAQKFFPIYNLYRDEIADVIHENRAAENSKESTARTRMDELAKETALLNIKKKYRAKFAEIIGSSRASRFFEAEREFREKLLNELKRRGDGRRTTRPSLEVDSQ